MQTGTATGKDKERYGRSRPCPICRTPDNRCVRKGEVHLCWNLREARELADSVWKFARTRRSADGGEWGCWVLAPTCPRCGRSDARCRENRDRTVFCANLTAAEATGDGRWRFGKQTSAERGQIWGFWIPSDLRREPRHRSVPSASKPAPENWHLVHQWLWEQASPVLQGRFPAKLADAGIADTAYSRYLTAESIALIEQEVDRRWRSGRWSSELIEASGWFAINKAFDSPLHYRTVLTPGRLIACFDLTGSLDQVRANPEVPLEIKKRTKDGQIKRQKVKYLQARGIPTRPYFPAATRALLGQLRSAGRQYALRIAEGEDKCECMAQNFSTLCDGTPLVWASLAGVWNFEGGEEEDLHPELVELLPGATDLTIAYDSDVMTKREVRQAMNRLAVRAFEATGGRLLPNAADWGGLLASRPELLNRAERWGLDDLWGHLAASAEDPRSSFERLLAHHHSKPIRRWWQRKGTPWSAAEQPALLTLEQARTATRDAIVEWFDSATHPLRSAHRDRVAVAATCGAGKSYSAAQIIAQRYGAWWQSPGASTAQQLWQALDLLEARKARTVPGTSARWMVLEEIASLEGELTALYHQDLGGPLLVLFKDLQALHDALERVSPGWGKERTRLPAWLAVRTGREAPEPGPIPEQMGNDSLACAHHEAVGQLGEKRHSPAAGACQVCVWGETGRCGFLHSLTAAHRAPVVFGTIAAVLNAGHEIQEFSQLVVDEALDTHLVETVEVSKAVRQLLTNLQRGQEGRWYTLPPLYTEEEIASLVVVFGEVAAAFSRYHTATEGELMVRGHRLADWCDGERLVPHLNRLKHLKPLRWEWGDQQKEGKAVGASYYPWERPRHRLGESGLPIHRETYGEEQRIEFEFIPMRLTSELVADLHAAICQNKAGAHLVLERRLEQIADPGGDGEGQQDASGDEEQRMRRCTRLHLTRPHRHLVEALRQMRVLNLDATPNRAVLGALLPDMRFIDIEAQWRHTRVVQVLSGPMGRATPATIREVIPLVAALGQQGSVLLFSHKQHVDQVDAAADASPISGLLDAHGADGQSHRMGWYGYQDRAVDDPEWKAADYLVLAGAHRVNLGASRRLALAVRRSLSVDGMPLLNTPDTRYRVERYGPEGYELVVQNGDPLVDALVEHERVASLVQACQRPRPLMRTTPLTIVLLRSDPLPAPFNRYVRVVSSIEELVGVTLPLGNKANHARHLEALIRHGETICDFFVEHLAVPSVRQVEEHGKKLWGVGGYRGKHGAIKAALALWSAQLLPSLAANERLVGDRPQFLENLRSACREEFEIGPVAAAVPLDEEALATYWYERYLRGTASDRLLVWMCTRHLPQAMRERLEAIEAIGSVLHRQRTSLSTQATARERGP
ncbi:DUF3854 domain-containing protein [Gloeobacter morelensis]|uniref:DUF3854 domain-containing protein n=1 Tax=Gloeobacter morelensis TaxID=2907343 RepID=UPI001E2DDDD7|nr:DUF3854 domain-containing protein [Gloeobacter morelensis]UFP97175.1 DUF3854 domain-containing protein [Gloeobacter morelensis MG652769]